MPEIFEQAARLKLRFDTPKGCLSVEDVWDLPLRTLDGLAVSLMNRLKNENVSFISETKPDPEMQLRFDLLKHVIDVRLEEKRAADDARAKAERKQKILGIIAQKQDEALAGSSVEELQALLAAL